MTTHAIIEIRTASLASDFGREYATRLFGAEKVEALPRISRGPRKGLLKGTLEWKKCTRGGWVKEEFYYDSYRGHVQRPGFISARILIAGQVVLAVDRTANV